MTLKERIQIVLGDSYLAGIVLCDWGSCQYTGAYNMFKALEKSGMDPLKVDVRYTNVNTKEYALDEFKRCMEHDLKRSAEKYDFAEELRDWNAAKDGIKSVDDCFEFLKDQAWDLWSAAPWIAEICFDNLELLNVEKADGAGPILNVMAQGENNQTGFFCWLMSKHGFVSDEGAFDGFDT